MREADRIELDGLRVTVEMQRLCINKLEDQRDELVKALRAVVRAEPLSCSQAHALLDKLSEEGG